VTLAGGSIYCIGGLSFTPANVIVSSVAPQARLIIASAKLGALSLCPVGTQVSIETYNLKELVERGEVSVVLN
jgi:hypothetical protein